MGNMFRCTLKSGGASGTGIPLIVTCSEDFAGKTITATDGTTTLTETCPSASPYTVQFDLPNTGSWSISSVIEGQTYSETISVTEYQLELNSGLSYRTWVSLGGLDPDDYASLSAVFADEKAVRRLMLVHASADYLIDCVTDDITVIDDFCANDTAMKWLGLCDYVCDGLTAITGVKAKLLASTYWERYLKDHVPIMTSNNAPYGVASAYQVFDGNASTTVSGTDFSYKFENPICPNKFYCDVNGGTLQASNDGATWVTPTEGSYYLYLRLHFASSVSPHTIQFYGRQLSVSVPVMTSDTAPFGQTLASSYLITGTSYFTWRAFADGTYGWLPSNNNTSNPSWLGYKFPSKMCPKLVVVKTKNGNTSWTNPIKLQGSNDGNTFTDITDMSPEGGSNKTNVVEIDCSVGYQCVQLAFNSFPYNNAPGLFVQFYGLDYSEKEFEPGTTKKWLYDHGVELETLDVSGSVTKGSDYLTLSAQDAQASKTMDLTPYDLLRCKVEANMSGTTALIAGSSASANLLAANSPNNNSLDVSNVDQSSAAGVKMTNAGVCDISEIRLEGGVA